MILFMPTPLARNWHILAMDAYGLALGFSHHFSPAMSTCSAATTSAGWARKLAVRCWVAMGLVWESGAFL
jgi:hypothetical protein